MNSPSKRDIHRTKSFAKDLKKQPEDVRRHAWEVAKLLVEDIFHPRLSLKKLLGYENVWRAKVKQDYRLVYTFDGQALYLLRIAHRKDIYQKPFQELE